MPEKLIAIANEQKRSIIKQTIGNNLFVQKDNLFVFNTSDASKDIRILKENGILVITPSYFYKKPLERGFKEIKQIEFDYSWKSNENIIIHYAENLDVLKIDKKEVSTKFSIPGIPNYQISNCGNLFAFIKANKLIVYANDDLDRYFEYESESDILNVSFSLNDEYLMVEIFQKYLIFKVETGELCFEIINDNDLSEDNELSNIIFFKNKIVDLNHKKFVKPFEIWDSSSQAKIIKGKLQKIIYEVAVKNKTLISQKNHSNLVNYEFYLSDSKLYAILEKSIIDNKNAIDNSRSTIDNNSKSMIDNSKYTYLIESYYSDEISTTHLTSKPINFSVSKNRFVVQTEDKNLLFYEKKKYSFNLIKKIKKEGNLIIKCCGPITVVYDSMNSNIEIYDSGNLRSVYNHNSCTGIEWSPTGLYFAVFSQSKTVGGLVQVFNCNGKLIYKKVYPRISKLQWRPYEKISEENICNFEMNEIDSEDFEDDPTSLLSAWKGYLISKIQELNF